MEFGTRPQDVIAALGPGIGGCCYEVGHEVVKEFAAKFPNAREWFEGPFDALKMATTIPTGCRGLPCGRRATRHRRLACSSI